MKRMLFLGVLALVCQPAYGQEDPDRRKTATALYLDGLRCETEKPVDLQKAIAKYKKAVDKAAEEAGKEQNEEKKKKIREAAAAALVHVGFCNEKLEPENVAEAQTAYGRVASDFGDVEPWAAMAKEKTSLKGVDVYLQRLHAALRPWRDTAARSAADPLYTEKEKAAWEKIQPLQKDAVAGLVWGLGHEDEVIRNFAAEKLAEIVDGPGIEAVIARLNDPNPNMKAGASAAFQKIFRRYNEAADLDRSASDMRAATDIRLDLGTDRAKASMEKLKPRADALQKAAADIRKGIPDKVDTEKIQGELAKLISDENVDPQVRLEAAGALGWIGRVQGGLAEALLKGMDSRNLNVRQACCRAAGAVDITVSADKHKLADKLIAIVVYEPAKPADDANKPPSGEHPDWANDGVVRQAAAEALEQIALVKSIPALIDALDDNEARVRASAIRALRVITGKDSIKPEDPSYEPDKPLKERKDAQAPWQQWWTDTGGVAVLVERFWSFQSQWKEFSAVKLFDPPLFIKEIESRQWVAPDPKSEMDRAQLVLKAFQAKKDVFVQDAVDLGPGAVDRLLKHIGGECDRGQGKPNAATRCYVAEAVARIIEKHGVTDAVGKVRDLVGGGDSGPKKAGAAMCLGFLPKDKVGAAERDALSKGLGASEVEVKEASGNALARVGEAGQAGDLTKAAQDTDANVQIAALRALSNIHPDNPDTIKALGEMIADESDTPGGQSKKVVNAVVREYAVDALGNIGNPAAMSSLLRSRRDTMRNVRIATTAAVQKCYKAKAEECVKILDEVLKNEKNKTDDRIGAALCLGDSGDAGLGKKLVLRLTDENPPLVLKDQDPAVRIAICQALGTLKAKRLTVVERLIQAVTDESEREAVRDAAYEALKATVQTELPDASVFKASDPKDKREPAMKWWLEWFGTEKGKLKDEA
jgi:HEAT repeat protein